MTHSDNVPLLPSPIEPERETFTEDQMLIWALASADEVANGIYFTLEEMNDPDLTEPPQRS